MTTSSSEAPEVKLAADGEAVRVIYHNVTGRQVVDLYPAPFTNRKGWESAGMFVEWLTGYLAAAEARAVQAEQECGEWRENAKLASNLLADALEQKNQSEATLAQMSPMLQQINQGVEEMKAKLAAVERERDELRQQVQHLELQVDSREKSTYLAEDKLQAIEELCMVRETDPNRGRLFGGGYMEALLGTVEIRQLIGAGPPLEPAPAVMTPEDAADLKARIAEIRAQGAAGEAPDQPEPPADVSWVRHEPIRRRPTQQETE